MKSTKMIDNLSVDDRLKKQFSYIYFTDFAYPEKHPLRHTEYKINFLDNKVKKTKLLGDKK